MAYQQLTGGGMWLGFDPQYHSLPNNGAFVSSVIDATGEKYAMVGRVWFPARTSTKAIRRVCFRFGTVTKAGGSALTVSLQDVATGAGPPGQPDETQDQTVAIANADAAFVSNTWYRTGTLSADRTVTYGDPLAVVIEYNGAGRLGSDAVNFSANPCNPLSGLASPALKTASWATVSGTGNLVLEMSDGTFGTLETCMPVKAFNTHAFNSGSAADEFAMPFTVPFKCKIDAIRILVLIAGGTSDFQVILYTGTTATQTVSVDGNTFHGTGGGSARWVEVPIPETELAAGTTYYVALKPTTANNVTAASFDVDDANHFTVYPGGPSFNYTTRVDAGSWAAATTTRRLMAGIRISSVDDGAVAASGGPTFGPQGGFPRFQGVAA